MVDKTIYLFPNPEVATLSEVGGKGLSLMIGSKEGLPVPSGFILTVAFFTPWLSQLKTTKAWTNFLKADTDELEKVCMILKKNASELQFTKHQEQEVSNSLKQYGQKALFAVRSSSPEEDLEGSSFAGGYETVLGVTQKNIQHALKKVFASCLDYRVAIYKQENGFDRRAPKIAVIVQEQIASDIAGVGFSLNPVSNNFDEAVFTANWGLGETVVAGTATPDTYIVNKNNLIIKEKNLGKKETALYLSSAGGVKEKHEHRNTIFALSDNNIIELTQLLIKIEELYKKPIDIEWAYSQNKLYLLQARPISTYIPLSPEMITPPGEQKRLYIDFTISVQGLYTPLSITGTSLFKSVLRTVGKILFLRDITQDITTAIPWASSGRLYLNVSNVLHLVDKKRLVRFINILDPLASKTIQSIEEKEYRSHTKNVHLLPVGLLLKMPEIGLSIIRARLWPEKTHNTLQLELPHFMERARALAEKEMPVTSLTNKLLHSLIYDVFLHTVPSYIAAKIAFGTMKRIAGKELAHAFDPLEVALPHNVTTQMGLELYHVSEFLPEDLTLKSLKAGLKQKKLPHSFMSAWGNFIETYGHRGPSEIDIAAPRYRDDPELLLTILLSLKKTGNSDNPQQKFEKNQQESRTAYEYLYKKILKKSPAKAKQFEKQYHIFETFGGYRETHKFYLIFVINIIREKILQKAKILYEAGRLQTPNQIFDLTLEDIDNALNNKSSNLIEHAKKNTLFRNRLLRIPQLPTIIDSRGSILRPPARAIRSGEIIGTAISPGIIQGPIKVLHSPNEKPLYKGEILVARATDPGWTPLFVNAAAVILEVGGVLQHGALVAREYGLPCVAGIEGATNLWTDGSMVEIDGSAGTVRLITKKPS